MKDKNHVRDGTRGRKQRRAICFPRIYCSHPKCTKWPYPKYYSKCNREGEPRDVSPAGENQHAVSFLISFFILEMDGNTNDHAKCERNEELCDVSHLGEDHRKSYLKFLWIFLDFFNFFLSSLRLWYFLAYMPNLFYPIITSATTLIEHQKV